MTPHAERPGGLDVDELAAVCVELERACGGALVRDAVLLEGCDDLLLFVDAEAGRRALQVAPGGRRARLCTTRRRFPRTAFRSGPRADRIAELLVGRQLESCTAVPGERAAVLTFAGPDDTLELRVELFGARGLWALVRAGDDTVLALSRLPESGQRRLRPGQPYTPPPPAPPRPAPPAAARFAPPLLESVDAHYTSLDQSSEADALRSRLERAARRQRERLQGRLQGAQAQCEAAGRTGTLRTQADMLLAYGSTLPPDASALRCPDPAAPDRELVVPRDVRVPPHVQAERLYRKARKHEDGARNAAQRLARLQGELDALDACLATLAELAAADPTAAATQRTLAGVHEALSAAGVTDPPRPPKPDPKQQRLRKITAGENFRRFYSREGLLVLVGRDNRQNDRLVTRVARGNDVWMHVGRGYAGSHVLIRVDKGRSPSLESLLDAATLAIHFSKVRGAELEEVIYCPAKNVRKPKGLPPGKVVPARTRTLRVRREPERLGRLLSSDGGGDTL